MNNQQASALIRYIQRGHGVIPTTGAEWAIIVGALNTIEGIANGMIEVEIKPVRPAAPDAGNTSEPVKAGWNALNVAARL